MTPIERIAYEQACEEQGADFKSRGIESFEDLKRGGGARRREMSSEESRIAAKNLDFFINRVLSAIEDAKEVGR